MIIMIITRQRWHDEAQELVDGLLNDDQEEIVHEPMTQSIQQEEIVHVPTNIQQEEIVQVPTNIQQEEIVHEPMNIHRVGVILPIAPKERDVYLTMYLRPLPSNRHGCFV